MRINETRFWAKVEKTEGCWLWKSPPSTHGYGQFSVNRRPVGSHIVSFVLAHGDVRSGLYVLHRCDNRLCVNPDHLFLGTHADNMADMAAKGRAVCTPMPGDRHPGAKLTNDEAQQVRDRCAAGSTQRVVAAAFGISQRCVWNVVNGNTYPRSSC